MHVPTQPSKMKMEDVRSTFHRLLPGASVRRRLLWRHTVSWIKATLRI